MPRKVGAYSENFPGSNYTDEEWAFINALAAYQKRWKRRYPSWQEVLYVLKCLGYRKVAGAIVTDPDPTAAEVNLLRAAQLVPPAEPAGPSAAG
jgi:hypothetical protein